MLDTDQKDLALYFNEDVIKAQTDSFKILQYFLSL